ncbi:uncharacterized protein LOC132041386 [Lycium ferocissimum]|uniref:uncharacterized protein LOC132041386 n=1 Tax=Lycium ferocissimum TaxID=112874 RepID=UPI00281652A0|nr:uncharacterized protein LOC132041386 [Lycium ferocissimum]
MVVAFFQGHTLPKVVTHTNIVLLPNKELVQNYSDLRPLINKLMSRVVYDRLEAVLPELISINQAGFVQGRRIIENALLAQEIVTDIRKRGKPANAVIKLDMEKAYNRVSWSYLIKAKGFFHSTRGVKQGYPLSAIFFILSVENESLKRIMKILQDSEAISGQLINKYKSAFYMYQKIPGVLSQQVAQITGFKRDQFPLKYLGCPIFHARRKKVYSNDLIKRVKNKLQNWKGKLLSFGGKAVLINSVLHSIPIYMLSAIVPTKYTINEPHTIFARFYWSTKEEVRRRHWSSWDKETSPDFQIDTSIKEVSYFMNAEGWDAQRLYDNLPINVCNHVLEELGIVKHSEEMDKAWWMASTIGKFTIGSAWNFIRKKAQTSVHFSKLWLKGEFAAELWQYYNAAVGIIDPRIHIHQPIVQWGVYARSYKAQVSYAGCTNIHMLETMEEKKYYHAWGQYE